MLQSVRVSGRLRCRWLLFVTMLAALCLTGCMRRVVIAPPKRPQVSVPPPARPLHYPTYYVAASRLNLRACPGMDCPRIGVLECNQVVEKLGEFEDWYQVRVGRYGPIGWVSSRYLSITPVPEPPTRVVTPPPSPRPAEKPAISKPLEKPEEKIEVTPRVKLPESPEEAAKPVAVSQPTTPALTEAPASSESTAEPTPTSPPATSAEPVTPSTAPASEPTPKRIRIM